MEVRRYGRYDPLHRGRPPSGPSRQYRCTSVRQLALQLRPLGPLRLRQLVLIRWLRPLLAATRRGPRLVTLLVRPMAFLPGSGMDLDELRAMGLVALSLRQLGPFPGLRLALGARLQYLLAARVGLVGARRQPHWLVPGTSSRSAGGHPEQPPAWIYC